MAIAIVGSPGAVSTGTTSVTPAMPQTSTVHNFLVAWCVAQGSGVGNPTDRWYWSDTGVNMTLLFMFNCAAGERAPTFSAPGASAMAACVAEFSGVDYTVQGQHDRLGGNSGTTSPQTATFDAADVASGELMIVGLCAIYTMAATKTTTQTTNHGGYTAVANNDATSTALHYRFGYAITTSNAGADTLTNTFTTTAITSAESLGMSFKIGSGTPTDRSWVPVRRREPRGHLPSRDFDSWSSTGWQARDEHGLTVMEHELILPEAA